MSKIISNSELLQLYWFIAEQIVQKQKTARWEEGLVKQISRDLQQEFPKMKRFLIRNLELMRKWYRYWVQNLLNSRSHAPAWECIPRHK